jgi:hypothetical protein
MDDGQSANQNGDVLSVHGRLHAGCTVHTLQKTIKVNSLFITLQFQQVVLYNIQE